MSFFYLFMLIFSFLYYYSSILLLILLIYISIFLLFIFILVNEISLFNMGLVIALGASWIVQNLSMACRMESLDQYEGSKVIRVSKRYKIHNFRSLSRNCIAEIIRFTWCNLQPTRTSSKMISIKWPSFHSMSVSNVSIYNPTP